MKNLGEEETTLVAAWKACNTMPLEHTISYALETKDALPTDEQSPEAEGASSPPSAPLSPRRALKQKFGGLAAREREVTRFVAQGKSNHAIANELVVG